MILKIGGSFTQTFINGSANTNLRNIAIYNHSGKNWTNLGSGVFGDSVRALAWDPLAQNLWVGKFNFHLNFIMNIFFLFVGGSFENVSGIAGSKNLGVYSFQTNSWKNVFYLPNAAVLAIEIVNNWIFIVII